MSSSLMRSLAVVVALGVAGCRAPARPAALETKAPPVPLPQASGTLIIEGVRAPVTVIRDRWGVPHITASNDDDLFFAQGFVQAQDRLFQMDLWRRSVQGRLSEVLGANFIERDAMTRRMQFRGDMSAEWTSYAPDAKAIATAFTRGINAWIDMSRTARPEEFRLAGWDPEQWRPEDLLNRTDAFVASAGAQDELFRARLAAAIGPARVDALLPSADGRRGGIPQGVDLGAMTYVLGDTLRRVGTRPFFSGLAASPGAGSNAWAVAGSRTDTGMPLLAVDPHRWLDAPSLRYLVHLKAPGWNVAGATSPWLPGVAIGHNDRVAWGMTAANVDVQDIYVERTNPKNPRQIDLGGGRWGDMTIEHDAIVVKGRAEPFEYERQYTAHGPVIGLDRERHLAYTVRWSGTEPGGAAELAALTLGRARSAAEFQAGLARWKMPAADFVYIDRDGRLGQQEAALVPVRRGANGLLPAAGWSGTNAWVGWQPLDRRPHRTEAPPAVRSANDRVARLQRISEVLAEPRMQSVDTFQQLQQDVVAWNASQLIPLLAPLTIAGDTDGARRQLLAWDRRMTVDSVEAALYARWERTLAHLLAERHVPVEFVDEVARDLPLVTVLTAPTTTWFDANPVAARDALLVDALASAFYGGGRGATWGSQHQVTFLHPLGVSDVTRRRFNSGPFPSPGYADTVFSVSADGRIGPSFRAVFDAADWDRSVVMNAPGQSAWIASPHARELAALWAVGEYFPLAFTPAAIQDNAEATLTFTPR